MNLSLMSDLGKYIWYIRFRTTNFVVPVLIPLYVSIGVGVDDAVFALMIYKLASTIFEVPTGYVGDKYGHRVSIIIGTVITGLSIAAMGFIKDYNSLVFIHCVWAFGYTFTTGSDNALLYSLSGDYKRDYARKSNNLLTGLMITSAIGGFLFAITPWIPFLLTGIAKFIALPFIWGLKDPEFEKDGDEYLTKDITVLKAIKYIRSVNLLPAVTLILASLTAIIRVTKYVGNAFYEISDYPVEYVGLYIASLMIMNILGNYAASKSAISKNLPLIMFPLFVILLGFGNIFAAMIGIYLVRFVGAIANVNLNTELMDLINRDYKSTVMSVKNLISTGIYTATLYVLSIYSGSDMPTRFFVGIGLVSLVIHIYYFYSKRSENLAGVSV